MSRILINDREYDAIPQHTLLSSAGAVAIGNSTELIGTGLSRSA